jgi:sensor histidine kinase YesM
MTAELLYRLQLVEPENQISYSIFYFGLIIENMFFSLGLGRKQKLVLEEKNASQTELINQLRENEKLRETINKQLDRTVTSLNKQAEIDRLDKINTNFERELAELKVTLLRSQMNPHFIFNSLNAIKLYIINNEKEKAVYYLNKFSKLIRKILTTTQAKQISLAEEIETLELYMNIENIRFENNIDFAVKVDETLNIDTIQVPCLFLQPFLENAIWHGLSAKKGSKELQIRIESYKNHFVKINIEDNGIGRKKSAELAKKKLLQKESFGIKLTNERMNMFYSEYKNSHSLKFTDLNDKDDKPIGTKVELIIPLRKNIFNAGSVASR